MTHFVAEKQIEFSPEALSPQTTHISTPKDWPDLPPPPDCELGDLLGEEDKRW